MPLEIIIQDELVDVVGNGFDAGIRLRERVPRDLMVVVPVNPALRGIAVASPSYFAAHSAPASLDNLEDHACVGMRFYAGVAHVGREFERDGRAFAVEVDGALTVSDLDLAIAAARGWLMSSRRA